MIHPHKHTNIFTKETLQRGCIWSKRHYKKESASGGNAVIERQYLNTFFVPLGIFSVGGGGLGTIS